MEEPVDRFATYTVLYLGGIVIAALVLGALAWLIRDARRRVNRARGAERPDWAPGIWMCTHCRSSNHPTATTCATCRHPRQELPRTPEAERQDWIPERIEVPPGSTVVLRHEPAAHADPGEAHWQVRVNGRTVGTAQRRTGAAALLGRIEGSDTVQLDVRGTGTSAFRVADAIRRFEAPRFPLDVPCPERTS